jgi:Holliday junction resolvase RusA-like endonuclease
MLPFEFTVLGPPVSHQSRNKAKLTEWRNLVRIAAEARWTGTAPLDVPLRIIVEYFHEGESVRIDNDNMLKPIQDSLIGLVYEDDRLITDTFVRKTSIDAPVRVRGYPLILLEALSVGDEFLHVIVDVAPSHEHPLK